MITLGIIGVVSAMTVPALMQNHQRKTYVVQLHKVYNELSQALLQYQTDKNAVNLKEAGLTSQNAVDELINKYFKVVQKCDTMDDCFADEYKKMNGRVLSAGDYGRDSTSFVLASGAAIRPMVVDGARLLNVGVDINGKKGPNIQGRDLFWLYVYSNGLIDDIGASAPLSEEDRDNAFTANCSGDGSAAGCFGKILNDNWEMTY